MRQFIQVVKAPNWVYEYGVRHGLYGYTLDETEENDKVMVYSLKDKVRNRIPKDCYITISWYKVPLTALFFLILPKREGGYPLRPVLKKLSKFFRLS